MGFPTYYPADDDANVPPAVDAVVYVRPGSSDSASGGSPLSPKGSLAAAVSALSLTGGKVIALPGTHTYSSTLGIPAISPSQAGIRIVGASPALTTLAYTGTDAAVQIGDGGATDARWSGLSNLSLDGGGAATVGARFNNTRFCHLTNVYVKNVNGLSAACVRMIADVSNYFNRIHGCQFSGGQYGAWLEGGTGVGANSNYFSECHFSSHASDGFLVDAGDSNRVQNCEFNGSTTTGVRIINNAVGNAVIGCQFDGTTAMWLIGSAAVTDTMLIANTGSGTTTDNGTRTIRFDTQTVSINGFKVGQDGKPQAATGTDTAIAATAGGATLPSAPAGFITWRKADGTQVKVPYYGF